MFYQSADAAEDDRSTYVQCCHPAAAGIRLVLHCSVLKSQFVFSLLLQTVFLVCFWYEY